MILAPNGRPVSSKRRTVIEVSITDATSGTQPVKMGLAADLGTGTAAECEKALGHLMASLRSKLRELGLYTSPSPVAGVSGGDPLDNYIGRTYDEAFAEARRGKDVAAS